MLISDDHVRRFAKLGFTLVKGFLGQQELDVAGRDIGRYFPTSKEFLAAPHRYRTLKRSVGFPYEGTFLNHVSLHPEIISFVERVLGTRDLRLGDSIVQAKYGTRIGPWHDQQLHNDAWGRNTLVPPHRDGVHQRVLAILYYTDVTMELGPTHVVKRQHTSAVSLLPKTGYSAYSRKDFPELYRLQEPVEASAGSLLLLSGATVYRGSAITAERGHRFAHFLNYHAAQSTWLDKQSWVGSPASENGPALCRFIEAASPLQRELLGFPASNSPYWDAATVADLRELYPAMDTAPYSGTNGHR